jgi:hypothetical protein|tara:strand:+ start:2112 stop:2945 length:834 start_codon:yes stop_codon:yes gene_type:complete
MQTNTIRVPWKTQHIVPIGDIQLGAGGVSLDTLQADVDRGMQNDAWFIGMGDYVDSESPSGRQKHKSAGFYDSTNQKLNEGSERDIETLMEIFEPTIGKWLGLHQGHHYHDYFDGSTTDTRLCRRLEAPFLGDAAFTRIQFVRGKTVHNLTVFSTHGTGSGSTQAAPLSKLEGLSKGIESDIYLINHFARKGAVPADRLFMDKKGHVNHSKRWFVATGGYMGAYTEGSMLDGRPQGSYVEKAMLTPTTLGGVIIKATPERKREDGQDTVYIDTTVTL